MTMSEVFSHPTFRVILTSMNSFQSRNYIHHIRVIVAVTV